MPVPYLFSNTPGGSSIPLAELDADFAYLTGSPTFDNVTITGNLQVNGNETVNGNINGLGNLNITGNGTFGGALNVGGNLQLTGCLLFGGQTICTVTGTAGSLVLSNNPTISSPTINNATLVSPILGTPLSGNLINCTGYPGSSLSGVVPIVNGGTGLNSVGPNGFILTSNGTSLNYVNPAATPSGGIVGGIASQVLYQSAPSVTSFLPNGIAGQVLTSNGTAAPSWAPISVGPGPISGVLPIANGGTAATTAPLALNNLLPSQAGHPNEYLQTDGAGNVSWSSVVGGVSSVSTTLSGLSFTPPTGAAVLSGTLGIASGGTAAQTAPAALNNLLPNQAGNAGKVLTTNGLGGVTWGGNVTLIPNIATLRTTAVITGDTVYVGGYYTVGDSGGGLFYGVSGGSYTDNGGSIITTGFGVTAGAAWIRVYESALNVKFFGAYGNGINDDTVAIQNAFNAANGLAVYIPSGTYIVSATMTVPRGASIFGDGPISSILQPAASGISVFNLTNNTPGIINGPQVSNLGFALPFGSPLTGINAINMRGTSINQRINFCTFDNISVFASAVNGFACALNMELCVNTHVSNCRFTFANFGVSLLNCADSNISNVDVQLGNNAGFAFTGGIGGAYAEGARVIGCSTNGQQIGAAITNQFWGEMTGCSFTTSPGGSVIVNGGGNWQINSCEFSTALMGGGFGTTPNVSIVNASANVGVNGCFLAIGTFGIYTDASQFITISDNKFANNANVDIYVNNSTQVAVSGNICESTIVPQSIVEGGSSNYNIVSNNIVSGTVIQLGPNSLFNNNLTY